MRKSAGSLQAIVASLLLLADELVEGIRHAEAFREELLLRCDGRVSRKSVIKHNPLR